MTMSLRYIFFPFWCQFDITKNYTNFTKCYTCDMCINKKPKSLKVHQLSCASIKDKIYILNQIWEILFTEVNNNDYNSFLVTLCLVECQQNTAWRKDSRTNTSNFYFNVKCKALKDTQYFLVESVEKWF